MNASKTLIAAIAAASIVGTVGFVSAQTAEPTQRSEPMTSQSAAQQDARQQPAAPADMSSPAYVAPAADTTMRPTGVAAPATDELQPKADRN